MKTFADLQFNLRQDNTQQAKMNLGQGIVISVIAGENAYSEPRKNNLNIEDYKSFECAILDEHHDGDYLKFVTRNWVTDLCDDVLAGVSREEITTLMERIQLSHL